MKNYITHLFKILTALSFLLLYIPGDTISAFLFMMLIILPFLIKEDVTGILDITQHRSLNITINLLLVAIMYWSVFYLLRSGIRRLDTKISAILCCLSIIICSSYAIFIYSVKQQTLFSIFTMVIFAICSFITIYLQIKTILRVETVEPMQYN